MPNERLEIARQVSLLAMDLSSALTDQTSTSFILFENVLPSYIPFCEDFGPVNLASTFRFCQIIKEETNDDPEKQIVVVYNPDRKYLTNAVFLLGAYMIMILGHTPEEVSTRFKCMHNRLASFRDVSPGAQNFHLQLYDCWRGLWRAKTLAWVTFEKGGFELADYEHCDSPLNADLHEVVPGKLIAMRGPCAILGGAMFQDLPGGSRAFCPAYYADIHRQYDVQVVVRLNGPQYDAGEFEREGLAVADLCFDDCAEPPSTVVAKFLAIAEAVPARWRCTVRRGWAAPAPSSRST